MMLRREHIGMAKGVVVAAGVAFSTYAVLETYVQHDSLRTAPLHAPGSIVVEVRSEGV